jgi:transcription elongation factor
MKQLIVHISDSKKAETLSKILTALDFVNSVEIIEDKTILSDNEQDFFALAGLWENRNITPKSIREAAWREENR